jgi:multiple sugar transport system permease protein
MSVQALQEQTVEKAVPARGVAIPKWVGQVVVYAISISLSLMLLFPLFWMVSTSLKTPEEANAAKPVWIPTEVSTASYEQILGDADWLMYLSNSLFVTVLTVVGTVASVTVVAYAFSRFQWAGRDIVFFLMLGTMMLPLQTTLVPQYVMFNALGWVNRFNPVTIPGYFAGGAALIFLMRQFMLAIPRDLDEAAMLDGASHFQIFRHIILPNCKPILTTVSLMVFVGQWNALQLPLIYLQKRDLATLPMAILSLYNPQQTSQPWALIMATSLLAVLPLIIACLIAQRYFTESVVMTGGK